LIELIELNDKDELIVKGYNGYIHSIVVSKGHGYISLDNEDYFIDGIVSVGNDIALPIKEDMLIVATEGSYNLQVTKNGIGGTKKVVVKRDEESSVDIGDLKGEAVLIGSISFEIEPVDATLNINGKIYEYDELVELPFGVYKMMIKAEGYIRFLGDLVVNETFSRRSIHLAKEDGQKTEIEIETTTGSEESTVEETESSKTTEEETMTMPGIPNMFSKINIDNPRGAEVYLDGVYKGVIPVSLSKEKGTHSIIIKKAGYETKTYTVDIPEGDEDVQLNFPGMTLEN
ncbi:MAG: PEGA domain-containing protein, partial [Clostridiales bacterium]|nr:PEGA domain-containing protein [Clostridiales bacterium]